MIVTAPFYLEEQMSLTISDQFGKPVVIERQLLVEHIKVGQVLWYEGFTSSFSWSCPAIITRVDHEQKCFRVRSLDDMIEQDQWYDFSISEHTSLSRKTMRPVDVAEVRTYLQKCRQPLEQAVMDEKTSLKKAEKKLRHFDSIFATLNI